MAAPSKIAETGQPLQDGEHVRIVASSPEITEFATSGLLDDRIKIFGQHVWDPHFGQDLTPFDKVGRKLIARAPDGNIWFTKTDGDAIGMIPAVISGPVVRSPGSNSYPNEQSYPLSHSFAGLQDITIAADGTAWFTERWDSRIGHLRRDGRIEEFPTPTADNKPVGITVGADGFIYFGETRIHSSKIGRLDPASGSIVEVALPDEFDDSQINRGQPGSLVTAPDGNVWFGAGESLVRITPSLQLTWFYIGYSGQQVIGFERGPGDLTVGSDGAIWFTVVGAGLSEIGRMTVDGAAPTWITVPGPTHDIAAGPDGNIWFTATSFYSARSQVGRIKLSDGSWAVSTIDLPSTLAWKDTFGQDYDVAPNQPLGLVGGAPSTRSDDWQLFFLEPRANQLGHVHVNFCRDLGLNCGYVWPWATDPMSCGTCPGDQVCGSYDRPQVCRVCTPTTCATVGAHCGTISDGCGRELSCGGCPSGQSCSVGHVCVDKTPPPPSCAQQCADDPDPIVCACECENARRTVKKRCQ